jgi:CelD/BcsL family acetyltransferase involved in cellulose biosynthesis
MAAYVLTCLAVVPPGRREAMQDLLERDSAEWRRLREAALERNVLSFELVPNRINTTSARFAIFRAKIPGGWLVALRPHDSLTFVPDPQHRWDGGSAE